MGRDPAAIERTVNLNSTDELELIDDFLDAGATHLILGLGEPVDLEGVNRLMSAARG